MNRLPLIFAVLAAVLNAFAAADPAGTRRVKLLNYPDCIELSNADTIVVLGHHAGGRVLKYAWRGKDALFLSPEEADWKPNQPVASRAITAGRFDIGPENLVPKREVLWSGGWAAEMIAPRAARLISQPDAATGVQLVREFRLAATGSHLACTQIIKNFSTDTKEWCHWSRTFAQPGGIGVVPLSSSGKFPHGYVMYQPGKESAILLRPTDPNIRQREGFIEVLGPPAFPKLGFDSFAGWFAYQMQNDLAFVKRYATYPDRVYNEVAGLTISIWYPKPALTPAVELEPIGPRERLAPGETAGFTEDWWLLENPFPKPGEQLDLKGLAAKVERETR
ncbi:MAG: hypothetical protein HY736_19345 [Verrucomicrobia bacterium]|nr:hypothetical protein [Verrucomicrobiota bacterium]